MTVFCGPAARGKSSLAMDTIYAEGQRRYVESLSSYARQFLGQMQKPKVEHINGLSPAISIEQKTTSKSPRSTVGTVTEIYDYLRILFARLGQPHCPTCDIPIGTQTADEIIDKILSLPEGTKLYLMAPVERQGAEKYEHAVGRDPARPATSAMRVDGKSYSSTSRRRSTAAASTRSRWSSTASSSGRAARSRIADASRQALDLGQGVMHVAHVDDDTAGAEVAGRDVYSQHLACEHVRPQLRAAQPAPLLVQQPARLVPDVRRAGRAERGERRRCSSATRS